MIASKDFTSDLIRAATVREICRRAGDKERYAENPAWAVPALSRLLSRELVETDASGRVERFVEKPDPKEVSTNLISAGIFVLDPKVLETIPEGRFCDFGRDVFPKLLAQRRRLYAMKPHAYILDVGTPDRLSKAQRDYESGVLDAYGEVSA